MWELIIRAFREFGPSGLLFLVLVFVLLNSNITITYRGRRKGTEQ